MTRAPYHPILSCGQALLLERALLRTEACEWAAMTRAGSALAAAMLEDWRELGGTGWRWDSFDGGAGVACGNGSANVAHRNGGAGMATACRGPRVLVLVGKGHNGGDALLAAAAIACRFEHVEIVLYRSRPLQELRPLCRRAWDELFALAAQRNGLLLSDASAQPPATLFGRGCGPYVFCIDGLLGMQFRPPVRECEAAIITAVNAAGTCIGLRAAVDMPSGLGDVAEAAAACVFRADFTYATGIAKRPVFKSGNCHHVGRVRYLDIGFFADEKSANALAAACGVGGASAAACGVGCASAAVGLSASVASAPSAASGAEDTVAQVPEGLVLPDTQGEAAVLQPSENAAKPSMHASVEAVLPRVQVLTQEVLNPFRNWRSPFGDKRLHGHLFILGGSAQMPGALLMNVQSALRSGAGLVTAFAPQSVAHVFAAQAPEAMWVPWPETEEGTLALEGQYLLATRLNRATALLMGSGMGRSAETLALLQDIAHTCDVPLVLDADALQPSVLAAASRHPRHGVAAVAPAAAGGSAGSGGGSVWGGVACRGRPVIITPHAGEFMRLCPLAAAACGDVDMNDIDWADALRQFCREHGVITILKGPQTRVASAEAVAYGLFGGPVLSRGGSGDVLAGLTGGCLVQQPVQPYLAAQQAVCWHGLAAQHLARERGQVSVTTLDLIAHLPEVIRG